MLLTISCKGTPAHPFTLTKIIPSESNKISLQHEGEQAG